MGVYGLVWVTGHPTRSPVPAPRYCVTFSVLNRLGSMHNTYNVPSEPERAAKARRAVVASANLLNICFFKKLLVLVIGENR